MKNNSNKLIVIVGATGLIGSTIFKYFSNNSKYETIGTIRDSSKKCFFSTSQAKQLLSGFEVSSYQRWHELFKKNKPDVVINCLGITKHLEGSNDPMVNIPINAYFPHFLNKLCQNRGSRLIHISTDCVFSGIRGGYFESDNPDAADFYGRSKALGEVTDGAAITLRTSTIGHELHSSFGLLNWFLDKEGSCQGYKEAYFSGVPTIELAKIIEQYVIPSPQLKGLYHVGGKRISKFDLLAQIAVEYGKKIEIIPNNIFRIDRSLISDRFYKATGYKAPSWQKLIKEMYLSK